HATRVHVHIIQLSLRPRSLLAGEQPPQHGAAVVHAQVRQRRRATMRSVETEGGSIDEAIQRALDTLRVAREQVEIEILENATRGLFGIGSRRARVRATVRQSLEASIGAAADGRAPGVSRETSPRPGRLASAAGREDAVRRAREVLEAILDHLADGPKTIEE